MEPTNVQRAHNRRFPGEVVEAERLRLVHAALLGQSAALALREAVPPAHSQRARHVFHETSALAWPIGQAPLFEGTLVRPGAGADWVIVNLSDDPLWTDVERFPVPGKVLRHLKRLCRAGIDFDTLVIAHEVPGGVCRPGEAVRLELILPPPPRRALLAARVADVLSRMVWFVAALPALSAAAPLVVAARVVDPILIGAKVRPGARVRPGEWASWFYVCHWTW